VLDRVGGPSSLSSSLSTAAELLEARIDAVDTNDIHWGTQSVLVATLSHLPEWGPELKLLRSGCNTILTEDQVDAFWTQARPASDSLASYVIPLVGHNSPDGARVE
jgi:hypothetical protein